MLDISKTLIIILLFAMIIQFCVTTIKPIVGQKIMSKVPAPVWSLAFGLILAVMFGIDIFAMLGYTAKMPIVSQIFTGLILSAGSSPIYELVQKLREGRLIAKSDILEP